MTDYYDKKKKMFEYVRVRIRNGVDKNRLKLDVAEVFGFGDLAIEKYINSLLLNERAKIDDSGYLTENDTRRTKEIFRE